MGQWSRIWLCCISDGVPKRPLVVALIVGTIPSKGGFSKSSGEDRTAIELVVAGVRGWDNELRRFFDASADGK